MDKLEYLDALKRAMTGLPEGAQAKTLAYYEQRFVDGVLAGRTEQDVANELDDPKKIAMTLRANTHMQAFQTRKNPASFLRMAVALVGLVIFNLFMVVPAIVYTALLASLYACGLAFYLGGTVVTASGLSGANEIRLDGPLRHVLVVDGVEQAGTEQTKVSISEEGVRITTEPTTEATPETPPGAGEAVDPSPGIDTDIDEDSEETGRSVRVIKKAESVASKGVVILTEMDDESRMTQSLVGLSMVLGGILLLLVSLVITRYTVIGIKRYIDMNFSLLKGH